MIKIRSSNLAVLVLIAAFICLPALLAGNVSGDMKLSPKPSYTVMRDWKATNGRRFDIAGCTLYRPTTLRTVVKADCGMLCMMIKSQNLKITAYTKGKVIYKTCEHGLKLCGTRITVIPLSDLKRGDELSLLLEPRGKGGRVISPVYAGTNNDMLMNVISRERGTVYALFAVFTAIVLTAAKLLRAKRKTAPLLCLLGAELTLFTCVLCCGDIAQFFIGSSLVRLVLYYISYALTPIMLITSAALLIIQKRLPPSYCR